MTTVSLTDAHSYTEAHVTDHVTFLNAPLLPPVTDGGPHLRPTLGTIRHSWRTQLDDQWWTHGNIDTVARWALPDGTDHPDTTAHPTTTLVHGIDDAPDWLADHVRRWVPAHLRLVVPGRSVRPLPTTAPDRDPGPDAPRVVTDHTRVEVVHHVWNITLTDTGPVQIHSPLGYNPPRWALPSRLSLTYHQRPDGDRAWTLRELSLTGPEVTKDNRPLGSGTLNITLSTRPDWLRDLVAAQTPDPAVLGLHEIAPRVNA